MSKRFTDDRKWSDEWWGSLPNDYRMIWLYLVDHCTIAGIWKKDFRGLNFHCNTNITEPELVEMMAGRLVDLGKYFFIPNFIKFQYSNGLASDKPMIVSVKKELEQNNLIDIIKERFGNDYPIIKVMVKVNGNSKGKGKGKEKKEAESEKFNPIDLIPDSWNGDFFAVLWDDFVESRKKLKAPLTVNSQKLNIKDLIKLSGSDWNIAKAIVETSIKRGWKGFFAPDSKTKSIVHANGHDPRHSETFKFDKA